MDYHSRHLDQRLRWGLSTLPALSIEGLRGIGKTTTAQRSAQTAIWLDRPGASAAFEADPFEAVEGHEAPLLLDEWQAVPSVWDAVRRSVDRDPTPGRFLLCGSSRAAIHSARHTGAGRIVSFEMRPMTLSERQATRPDVSITELLEHGTDALPGASSTYSISIQRAQTEQAGLPGLLAIDSDAHQVQVESYLRATLVADLPLVGGVERNATRLWRYLTAYAACVGTTTHHSTIFNAAGISNATASDYHNALSRLGIIVELPAFWTNALKQLSKTPKRHLADAAFAATPIAPHLRDPGRLWENAVVAQLRAVAEATIDRPSLTHLRTANGRHEVDLLITDPSGRTIAIEAKLSPVVDQTDTKHLRWLRDRLPQVTCGLVVYPGERVAQLGDGVAAVPLAALA